MIERSIRKLGLDYLRILKSEPMSLLELQTRLEKRFTSTFLNGMLFSIIFYHIKRESYLEFIVNNRHELLPDKLSSMVQTDHTVLSYILSNETRLSLSNNQIYRDVISLFTSIKEHLKVNEGDFDDDGNFNLAKGKITRESKRKLEDFVKPLYESLLSRLHSNDVLVDFYRNIFGVLPLVLYITALKFRKDPKIFWPVKNLALSAPKKLLSNGEDRALIRPFFKIASELSGQKRILHTFDSRPYSKCDHDIYIAIIYCIYDYKRK